jgi:hypothetical protein
VLFHGPAGHGKTTCATELAYRHLEGFGLVVWHGLPRPGADISGALLGFAHALDASLMGLHMAERVRSRERLEAFWPLLAEFLEQRGVLLVLDNLEGLLTEAGGWRDDRWAPLMAALTEHRGQSRVVLASRRVPAALDQGVQLEAIGPLSRAEQALLARELPRLGALIRGDKAGRALVRQLLETSDGSPARLLDAERATADPARMEAMLHELGAGPAGGDRPLRQIDVLRGRMDALLVKAEKLGLVEDRELSALAADAAHLLYTAPFDLPGAEAAVAVYQERLATHEQWRAAGDG